MMPCNRSQEVQDYLDEQMSGGEASRFREHLGACEACAAELALYTRVFAALERAASFEPRPQLVERILDRVVPSRVRHRRWVRALGWGYAGTLTASLALVALWLLRPGTLPLLASLHATASHRLVQLVLFGVNAAAFAILSVADGWKMLRSTGTLLAPLTRALGEVLAQPTVITALWPAAIACGAVLWWMRARGRAQGGRHVGVLGF